MRGESLKSCEKRECGRVGRFIPPAVRVGVDVAVMHELQGPEGAAEGVAA